MCSKSNAPLPKKEYKASVHVSYISTVVNCCCWSYLKEFEVLFGYNEVLILFYVAYATAAAKYFAFYVNNVGQNLFYREITTYLQS